MTKSIAKSLDSEGTFTDWISPTSRSGREKFGKLNISISGTWDGTVTLQRSFDGGTTPLDVEHFVENGEHQLEDLESVVLYRLGIKDGNYTSGAAAARLSK